MSLEHLILLALVQGITEFLPISSSGHLNLVHLLTDLPDEGVLIDVGVHAGTLLAVVIYFWRDVWSLTVGFLNLLRGRPSPEGRLAIFLIVATVPTVLAGFWLLKSGYTESVRALEVITWANIAFAILLYLGDRMGGTMRRLESMTANGALAIGFMQVLSLIPGASRAGVTITMARALGFERTDAARFSMLLSIPTILGAATASIYEVWQTGNAVLQADMMLAVVLAFVSAIVTIALFMKMLTRATLTPFVIYRLVLGGVLLGFLYL